MTLLAVMAGGAGASQSSRLAQEGQGPHRLRPPQSVRCPRDHLTVFTGGVVSFQRATGGTTIGVHTDEATSETFVLTHPGSDDPTKWFLLRGKPFGEGDWEKIRSGDEHLRPGVRARVWVCDDGSNPVIDWLPPTPAPKQVSE